MTSNSFKVIFKVVFHLYDVIFKLWVPLSQLLLNVSTALTIFEMLPKLLYVWSEMHEILTATSITVAFITT